MGQGGQGLYAQASAETQEEMTWFVDLSLEELRTRATKVGLRCSGIIEHCNGEKADLAAELLGILEDREITPTYRKRLCQTCSQPPGKCECFDDWDIDG